MLRCNFVPKYYNFEAIDSKQRMTPEEQPGGTFIIWHRFTVSVNYHSGYSYLALLIFDILVFGSSFSNT